MRDGSPVTSAAAPPLALVLLALGWPAGAAAEDPPFVGWTALLPGLSVPYDATSPDDCIAGRVQCVDKTVRQMTRRFEPLASSCDHNAIFALTYLRVTEEYRRTVESPTFFDDTPFVNHEDVVFANYYFAAYDAWKAGERAHVPPAWRIAFDAARGRSVSAYGDLLLGINAHVQRDLPFVVYSLGMVKPDGTSRKPDHDRVNRILNRVTDDVIAEIARRFDPTIDDTSLPTTLDDFGLFQQSRAGGRRRGGMRSCSRWHGLPRHASWWLRRSRRTPHCRRARSEQRRPTRRFSAAAPRATRSAQLTGRDSPRFVLPTEQPGEAGLRR